MSSNTPTSPGNGDPVEDKNRPLDKVRHNSASVSESVNNQANGSLDEDSESKSVDSEITFASATSAMPHQSSPMAAMTSRLSQGTVSRLTPAVLFPSAGATLVTRPVLFIHSLGGDSQPGRQVRNAHTLSYGDMVNIAYGLFVPAIKQDLAVHGTKSVAHILFPSLRHDSSQSDISMEILEVAMWYALGLARMSESGRHALRHSWDKVVDGKGPQAYWAVFWERASTLILAGNVARAASDITAGGLCVRTPMGIGAPALPNVENLTRLVATTNYERQKIVERLNDPNALICRISHLIVHPDHQRQGHGTLVLSKICEEMDTNKAYGIAIAPSNLVGWYRKFGFEAFGRLEYPFDNLQYVFRKPAEVGIIPVPDPNRSATGGSGIVGEAATRARDFALGLAHELIMPELVEVMDAHLKYAGQAYQTQDGEREEGVPTCVDIKTLCALAEVHTHQLGLVGDHAGRPESTDAHPERSEFTYGPIENGQAGDDGKPHYHIDKPREPGDHIERPEPVEACTEQPRSPGRLAEGHESANNHIERPKTAEGHIERPEPRRLRGYPPSKKLPKRKN